METQIEKPAPTKTTGLENCNDTNSNTNPKIRKDSKQFAVLKALAEGGSFNRFEAERKLHDHCLHSTVSTIQGSGIQVHRESEKVPCLGGTKVTNVMRYRLLPLEIKKAEILLGLAG
ncbi:MAG: hypothetical protein O7D86_05700 [Proteobacteria bacterium]|nr:hypothetical protein [Pseudomonadota bacterium]